MNITAAGSVAILLLEKGGIQSITDLRTLVDVYSEVHSGKTQFADILTKENLDAAQRVMDVLAMCIQDDHNKILLQTFISSI